VGPAALPGLWFGLFNPCPDGRNPVADIYVCGSERFVADPTDNHWAVGPHWWPDGRYAGSKVFADLCRIAYRQWGKAAERMRALQNDAEYPLCLGYGAFAVRELLGQVEPSLVLGKSESIGVAVGFDDGDFVLLGKMTRQGLVSLDPADKRRKASLAPVLEALRSSDRRKVFRAIVELPRFGKRARQAVPELVRLSSVSRRSAERDAALGALADIAPDDLRAKAAMLRALQDKSPFVRQSALQALISVPKLSAGDLAKIKSMENDSDKEVADWSEIALRNIGGRRGRARRSTLGRRKRDV
jgi:hypothetical protein